VTEIQIYDVAVIGYGPTGVTAANFLGRYGLNVLVIERDPSVYHRARAIGTEEEVLRIWQRLGLAERLKEDMIWDKQVDFVDSEGRSFIDITPTSRGHGHPTQTFLYQPALEKVLRAGVDRYPNVEVRLHTECLRVKQDCDSVELLLVDSTTELSSRVSASYVIAADGGSSPTRTQLGIGFEGRTYEDRWIVIDTEVVEPWPAHDQLRFHCDPKRPAFDCPTPLGHHRFEFPILPGEDEKDFTSLAAAWALLNDQGVTDRHVKILRAVPYSHHVRFADRWRVGRIFFAGDAAHVMPPWIGQGMAAGVRDAANLCWKLAAVVHGDLPASVLDSYEEERQPHVRSMTRYTIFFARLITERRVPVTKLRNMVCKFAMRIPPVGAYMRELKWFPKAHYAKGFLAPSPNKAVGHLPPQPWVFDESGVRVRLDDALGSRWVVLRIGAAQDDLWARTGVPTVRLQAAGGPTVPGTITDIDGSLIGWMTAMGATALAIRPDGYVYAAAAGAETLSAPPIGLVAHTDITNPILGNSLV